MGRNRESLGWFVGMRKNMINILPEILKEYIFKGKNNQHVHFILKFALHSCKIERTKLGFLEKKLQKSPEKYLASVLARDTEEMQCIQRTTFFPRYSYLFLCVGMR